jgi:hypothetical protein
MEAMLVSLSLGPEKTKFASGEMPSTSLSRLRTLFE